MIFLDINIISKSCIKIRLTNDEAREIGIDYDNFEAEAPETQAFIEYIITVMNDAGMIISPYDQITVEIFEQSDGDIIIYVSSSSFYDNKNSDTTDALIWSYSADAIIDYLINNRLSYSVIKDNTKLYTYNNVYCLITTYSDYTEIPKIAVTDRLLLAKIKEYGKIICNTPFESLI